MIYKKAIVIRDIDDNLISVSYTGEIIDVDDTPSSSYLCDNEDGTFCYIEHHQNA